MIETMHDRILKKIRERIKMNDWRNTSPAEAQYKKNRDALSIENGVIVLGTRPVAPSILRQKLI